nr:mediator of RNA polymerase II transcription subunit 18 [Ipomoea batatas]
MQHVEALEILLHGLCGVRKERLCIHELCLKSVANLGLVSSEIRLICDLEQPEPTWTVRHVGGAMRGAGAEQISVLVRPVVESKMLKLHATDEAVPVTPGIQLVEVTAPSSSENYSEVAAAVSSFCEYLAPLLHLSKPGNSTGVVPTAAAAAASLISDGGGTKL